MARLCIIILALFSCSSVTAQHFEWVTKGGGEGDDVAKGIAVDSSGNVYVAGYFTEKAIFSEQTFTGRGFADIFLAKYNGSGELVWFRQAGGRYDDQAVAVGLDRFGNIYITGYIGGRAEFGSSELNDVSVVHSNGLADIFLAKYNAEGILQWVKNEGGSNEDQARDLAIDKFNNIFITGYYNKETSATCNALISNGSDDIFLAKYSPSGNCLWVESAGGAELDKSLGVAVDTFGNVFITGFFYGVADFNNSIKIRSGGLGSDGFLAKYNAAGLCQWAKKIGGPYSDAGYDIGTDDAGKIYVTGYFAEFAPFDNIILNAYGYNDIFLAKYDQDGKVEWALNEGGVSLDLGIGLDVDPLGNVFLTGFFDSVGVFGNKVVSGEKIEFFIARYSTKGILDWMKQAGGQKTDVGSDVVVSLTDSRFVYFTGYYTLTASFDKFDLEPAENKDMFVGKISPYGVGLEQVLSKEPSINIYPNPNSGRFYVELPAGGHKPFTLSVLDINGRVLWQRAFSSYTATGKIPVRLDVKSGIYFVKLELSDNLLPATAKRIIVISD